MTDQNLSTSIDTLIKPFLKHDSSYIRDSVDFQNGRQRDMNGNTMIAAFDVTGLSTT